VSLDLDAIRARATKHGNLVHGADALWVAKASADDVPALLDALHHELTRREMMTYQRGAVLGAVHSMQIGNHTVADVAARVEEIFSAGMAAEIKRGYDEQLAAVEQDRDKLSDELAKAAGEFRRARQATRRLTAVLTANASRLDVPFTNADGSPWELIPQARIDEIAKDAVVEAVRGLAQERMGIGELLSDDLPDDAPEDEQEAEMDRLEAAIRLHLPEEHEKALREQIAAEIEAYQPEAHPIACPPATAWEAGRQRAATIARHGRQ